MYALVEISSITSAVIALVLIASISSCSDCLRAILPAVTAQATPAHKLAPCMPLCQPTFLSSPTKGTNHSVKDALDKTISFKSIKTPPNQLSKKLERLPALPATVELISLKTGLKSSPGATPRIGRAVQ